MLQAQNPTGEREQMDIKWEEPPQEVILRSRAGSGAKFLDFAMQLRKHESRWAVLPVEQPYATLASAQSAAQNIRRGVTKAFAPKGAYEAVAGPVGEGEEGAKIWVRFVGDPQPDDATPPDSEDEGEARIEVVDFARKVRAWARENGLSVTERGRLPDSVYAAYAEATGETRPV